MDNIRPHSARTRGHDLFEAWLGETYGVSRYRGRPKYSGMRLFVDELGARLRARRLGKNAPKTAVPVYTWFGTALPNVHRRPNAACREAIASMSRGVVPVWAWESEP